MSECERISGLFGELHEEQVDSETETVVWKHLHSCPGCKEDFKWYGMTVRALTNLDRVAPPREFIAQLNSETSLRPLLFLPGLSPKYLFFRTFCSAAPCGCLCAGFYRGRRVCPL